MTCSGALGELDVPTFAFYNGAAMGGGVEVGAALHLPHHLVGRAGVRAARDVPRPGARLGRHVPAAEPDRRREGAQGHHREPARAEQHAEGPQAYELGIADAIFEPADFLEESLRWTAGVLNGESPSTGPRSTGGKAWDDAVAHGPVDRRRQARTAPRRRLPRALDLVAAAKDRDRDEGFAAEDEALADLIMSDELRAGLYAFDLVQKRAKRPAGAPDKSLARPVTKVGIVGAGLMASQLALLFARRLEVPVVMTDLDQERLDKGVGYVHAEIDKLLGKGRVSPDKANRLKSPGHGLARQGGLRRRRLRHRGRVRGDGGQAEGVRRGRGATSRPSACSRRTPRRCR